jgi:hypothetical protein
MPEDPATAALLARETIPPEMVNAPLILLLPDKTSVPEPSFVTLPPELVRAEARVTFWPLVSSFYCWSAALEKRSE